MNDIVMRRDMPIKKGRKVRVRVIRDYEVELDEDLMQGCAEVTADVLESWIGEEKDGVQPSTDRLVDKLDYGGYPVTNVEHTVHLADVANEFDEVRFELPWERRMREGKSPLMLTPPSYMAIPEPADG